ncbi:MAG: hypothetical protein A2V70_18365 [Planctomycetes bacterium RBG_13_63_9]|nr:MAG: hypothetical protein A2V70_18365 [Planctomycetes bacterium RBG_13_63_9]
MRILTRYVLAEMAKAFLVSLIGLTLLIIIVGVIREAAMQSLPFAQVVQLIPYILPEALRIAIPVTLLLAATSVYGRMSGSNEVVAAKALGISPMAILWPTFVAAFLLSLVTVWLNDLAVSWGRHGAQRVVVDSVEDIAYSMLRAQKSYSCPSFSINVNDVKDRRLLSPILTLQSGRMVVTAEEAELQTDKAANVLRIILHHPTLDADGRATADLPGQWEQEFSLQDASRMRDVSALPSWSSLRVISEQVVEQEEKIEQMERDLAARAAYQMLCGDFDDLTDQQWNTQAENLEVTRGRWYRLLTEPHRRWSDGFSCLCFVWVGAPMAIRLRNRDFLTSFFLCFLPILIVYYPLLIYGVDGAKNGTIPPYGVWAKNLLLVGWGAWLLRKVIRY